MSRSSPGGVRRPGPETAGTAESRRPTIVCLSPQEWQVDLPTNRQQIMARVAARGHAVLYVETGAWAGRRLRELLRRPQREPLGAPNIEVLAAPTLLPWGHKYRLAARINAALTARAIRSWSRRSRPRASHVLWLYDPCFADCIGRTGERFAVYDCVDDYPEQSGGDTRKRALVTAYDRLAASRSRLVFATSRPLLERHRATNPDTELVRNVGDFAHFAPASDRTTTAEDVANLARPVIGFAGNFTADKVDFDLLEEIAEQRQDWSLVLVGPTRPGTRDRVDALARRPNVHVVPAQPYDRLPSYVACFDVALIPYLSNAYTRSCFPLKTFEYLAAGKPVVASGLPELADLEPHVTLASGPAEFVAAVDDALVRTSAADAASRQAVAARNTWETRTARLLDLVETALANDDGVRLPPEEAATTLSR